MGQTDCVRNSGRVERVIESDLLKQLKYHLHVASSLLCFVEYLELEVEFSKFLNIAENVLLDNFYLVADVFNEGLLIL